MVKKIKFPLEMANEVKVRTLEELQENFDLEKVLSYYVDGKLLTWLNDRYYETEAQQISRLNGNSPDFKSKLCEILGVDIKFDCEIDFEVIEQRNAKLAKLKQFTTDMEIIKNVDSVAFDQEELADLLDEEVSPIYLFGDKFTIPVSKENTTYIGINSPQVSFNSQDIIDFVAKNIQFQNIDFQGKIPSNAVNIFKQLPRTNCRECGYPICLTFAMAVANGKENLDRCPHINKVPHIPTVKQKPVTYEESSRIDGTYKTSALLDYMMKNEDIEASKRLFKIVSDELASLECNMEQIKFDMLVKDIREKASSTFYYRSGLKLRGLFGSGSDIEPSNLERFKDIYDETTPLCIFFDTKSGNYYQESIFLNDDIINGMYSNIDKIFHKQNFISDISKKIYLTKELINYFKDWGYRQYEQKVYFVFLALFAACVDKTDYDKKISTIVAFAHMADINENELFDVTQVIKMVFGKNRENIKFKEHDEYGNSKYCTEVPRLFKEIVSLGIYNRS